MGQAYHKQFQRELMNIKTQDISSVAARCARVLRDYPRDFIARKTVVDEGGRDVTLDMTGSVFDSVWNENVGSCFACINGGTSGRFTLTHAKNTIDGLYGLANFVAKHGNTIMFGEAKKSDYATDLTNLTNFFSSSGINTFAGTAIYVDSSNSNKYEYTYAQLGFYLDQATLNGTTESRPFDVYEFMKWISKINILDALIVLRSTVESDAWKATVAGSTKYNASASTYKSNATTLQTMKNNVVKLTGLVEEMIIHMAHLVDGLSACEVSPAHSDAITNFATFSPVDNDHYEAPSSFQLTSDTKTFRTPKSWINKRIVVCTKSKARLVEIYLNGVELETALANTSAAEPSYNAVYVTKDFSCSINSEVRITINRADGTAFSASMVKVYINKDS